MIFSAAIECSTACRSCGAAVPVNACVATVHCPACGVARAFTPGGWATRLREPLANVPRFSPGEGTAIRAVDPDGEFELQYVRLEPPCPACGGELALEAIEAGAERGSLECPGCRARISVRQLPGEHDAPVLAGVRFLVGESVEQLGGEAPKRGEAIALRCDSCGGALEADGSTRTVVCRYCRATVMLSDDVWLRLHPPRGPSRWFVIFEADEASARARAIRGQHRFNWFIVEDVIGDAAGNVYAFGCGKDFDDLVAWSFSRDGELRWVRHGLAQHRKGHAHVFVDVTNAGELLVHGGKAHEAIRLSTKDGAVLGTFGTTDPKLARLDFADLDAFACDRDGTFLALAKRRLLRFDANGAPTAVWPPRPVAPAPPRPQRGFLSRIFFGADPSPPDDPSRVPPSRVDFANVGDAPTEFDASVSLAVGHCGALYARAHLDRATRVLKFDRTGRRLYSVEVPCATSRVSARRMGGDAQGNGYVLGDHAGEENSVVVYRITPDGAVKCVVRGKAEGGPLDRRDVRMAVGADGTIAIVGDEGLKIFDGDGGLRVAWAVDE